MKDIVTKTLADIEVVVVAATPPDSHIACSVCVTGACSTCKYWGK